MPAAAAASCCCRRRAAHKQLTYSGWGYLGGGDNGLGQNAGVRGVASDPCPAGTTKQMLNGDGLANPGEDPNKLLSDFCVPCGPGVYCDSVSATPTNCPAGTYGAVIGAKSSTGCMDCPIGTYQDMDGQFECQICKPNTFASAPGSTACQSCGDGYEVSAAGSNMCNPCSPGLYRDSAISEQCMECPAGTSSGEGESVACAVLQQHACMRLTAALLTWCHRALPPAAASQCNVCLPGSYSASPKSSVCTECPRGSFQGKYGQQQCKACYKGTYQDSRAAAKCKVCPVGTYNPNEGSVSFTACL